MTSVLFKQADSDSRVAAALLKSDRVLELCKNIDYSRNILEACKNIELGSTLYILGLNVREDELKEISKLYEVRVVQASPECSVSKYIWSKVLGCSDVSPLVARIQDPNLVCGLSLLSDCELYAEIKSGLIRNDIAVITHIAHGASLLSHRTRMAHYFIAEGTEFDLNVDGASLTCILLNINKMHVSSCWGQICKLYPVMVSYTDRGRTRLWSVRSNQELLDVGDMARDYGGDGSKFESGFSTVISDDPYITLSKIKTYIGEKYGKGIRSS